MPKVDATSTLSSRRRPPFASGFKAQLDPRLNILYEDSDLLVVNKPADLVCHPTKTDVYSSLVSRVRLHLGPSIPAQLIHRLDRETSGIVVFAKTLPTAKAWRQVWERREVWKGYQAIVHGRVVPDTGIIDAPLGKDENSPVAIKDCVRPDGAAAVTEFRVLNRLTHSDQPYSLLQVAPQSGRKHQIRIHLASIGHPIVGDKLYGPDEQIYLALVEGRMTDAHRAQLILPQHALHAGELRVHCLGRTWHFKADPEPWFTAFLQSAIPDSTESSSPSQRKTLD